MWSPRILSNVVCLQVTNDGDILYVFPGFARGKRGRAGNIEADYRSEESETGSTAAPEVLQFEVPYSLSSGFGGLLMCASFWKYHIVRSIGIGRNVKITSLL